MLIQRTLILLALSLVLFLGGCAKTEYYKAMQGRFSLEENNRIITSKCRDCHTHKDFQAEPHLEKVAKLYKDSKYSAAKACSSCHYTKKGRMDSIMKEYTFFFHPVTVMPDGKKK